MFKRVILVVALVCVLDFSLTLAQGKEGMRPRRGQMMIEARDKAKARLDELTRELKLKSEQGAKIKEILTRSHNEARAILEDAKLKVREIRIKAHDEIRNLLTEEQRQRFGEIRKRYECPPKVEE